MKPQSLGKPHSLVMILRWFNSGWETIEDLFRLSAWSMEKPRILSNNWGTTCSNIMYAGNCWWLIRNCSVTVPDLISRQLRPIIVWPTSYWSVWRLRDWYRLFENCLQARVHTMFFDVPRTRIYSLVGSKDLEAPRSTSSAALAPERPRPNSLQSCGNGVQMTSWH
jgi:hypothetical protein